MLKIHINIDDLFYSRGLQDLLKLFFNKLNVAISFSFGDERELQYTPNVIIHHFINGELYACPQHVKFNAPILIGVTNQKINERDLPNCFKGIITIGFKTSVEEFLKLLNIFTLNHLRDNTTASYYKWVGCYNCKSIKLNPMQVNFLKMMAEGLSSKEAANSINISIKKFYYYKRCIYKNFGLNCDSDMLNLVYKLRFV